MFSNACRAGCQESSADIRLFTNPTQHTKPNVLETVSCLRRWPVSGNSESVSYCLAFDETLWLMFLGFPEDKRKSLLMPMQPNFEEIVEPFDGPGTTQNGSLLAEVDGSPMTDGILPGFTPDAVPFLVAARQLELVYPLLHALTRGSLSEFLVRVASLEALIADGRSPLSPSELSSILYWFTSSAKEHVIRILRESGWLIFEPASGYRISDAGHFVATMLAFLRARLGEGDFLPTVEGIEYMIRLGVDPVRHLQLLRTRLEDLRSVMEVARNSHSEVILQGASERLQAGLSLSERIRLVLSRIPLEMSESRRVAHEIHDLLSRLHGVGSDLHAAMTEVGRQYLHLVGGLTTADIVATLMKMPLTELASAAHEALRPLARRPTFLVPELLAASAEAYLSRQLHGNEIVEWKEPPPPEVDASELNIPEEITALLDDLDRLRTKKDDVQPLSMFVPRGTTGESFLRASLLPLLDQRIGGEGVAGRLSSMNLALVIDNGNLVAAAEPLSEISAGTIQVRKESPRK